MKLLQLGFSLLLLAATVGLLLAVTTAYHLPVGGVWVILALAAAIVCAALNPNQKEDQK